MNRTVVIEPAMDEDMVLWRYLDTAKYLDFLHSKTLHFSRGDQFEDRYEGSFTNSLRNAIQGAYEKNDLDITYDEFKKRLRERVFVSCWHKNADDSMAMWELYGKGSLAVAVTTTVGRLQRQMSAAQPRCHMSIRKVSYVKYWADPHLDIKPYSKVFAYKVKAYEYEKEVRAIIDRFEEDFDNDVEETGMYLPVEPNELVKSVIVMPEAPEWYVRLIQAVSRKFELQADIHRSKLAFGPI